MTIMKDTFTLKEMRKAFNKSLEGRKLTERELSLANARRVAAGMVSITHQQNENRNTHLHL